MRYIPIIVTCLLLAAHHFRAGEWGLIGLWLTLPLVLLLRRRWADRALQLVMAAGALEWLLTLQHLLPIYRRVGMPAARTTIILAVVALVTAASGLVLESRGRRRRLPEHDPVAPGLGAFLVAGALLAIVQSVVARPMILAERFLPAAGWWEGAALAFYAGWLSDRLREPRRVKQLRPKVWLLFSVVFFTQLLVGLAGVDKLLMSGKLHLPVPALIAAGPLYRGGGLFMAILFTASVLVAGPAWCSWLCYIGAWDDRFARARKRPDRLPAWRRHFRWIVLIAVFGTAFALGRLGVGTVTAAWLAAGFGLVGVGIMATWSRRTGHMAHCTAWCPMGFVATRLGKISPWRLRISDGCTDCGACTPACRYDALYPEDVLRRMPAEACTLCGDCISRCPTGSIEYRYLKADPETARRAFFIIVAALHAVWLGVARL
ncbi:MAG TPA: 4Fe-4S dicluster domain-containing protein [Candidatus Krumholzibacteria bacterium]|nr:4Fe-4S dicluster domain-containing protein [Candidatus Krumholzibacteria bacterium]